MDFDLLIQQPESQRDEAWEKHFLEVFPKLKVQVQGQQAQNGPDGWPYLFVKTAPEASEDVTQVISWLAGRGIGLVVNPHKMLPDYIFPYGMIWNYVETGQFLTAPSPQKKSEAVYTKDMIMGPPSEKYLPPYVREVLREFLKAQGFTEVRVLVVSSKDYKDVDLVISEESLKGLAKAQHRTLADMLAWFLPLHYTLVLGSELGLPAFSSL